MMKKKSNMKLLIAGKNVSFQSKLEYLKKLDPIIQEEIRIKAMGTAIISRCFAAVKFSKAPPYVK